MNEKIEKAIDELLGEGFDSSTDDWSDPSDSHFNV